MRAQGPTFWLLKGDLDWHTGYTENIVTDGHIRLASDPTGPLSLNSPDGSLGGLRFPQGMALDLDSLLLYLLDQDVQCIKRFTPVTGQFQTLPSIGGVGSEARQFQAASAIAVAGGNLYVTDPGNHRVQVFALHNLILRYLWGPWDGQVRPVEPDDASAWEPVDLAACGDRVAILDRRYGRVFMHQPGKDVVVELIEGVEENQDRFSRITLDRQGRVYLLDAAAGTLSVFDRAGRYQQTVSDAGEIIGRFDPPAIRLDRYERFCLPASLAADCPRSLPGQATSIVSPLTECGVANTGLPFDRQGNALAPSSEPEAAGPWLHARQGRWISTGLDSRLPACQWHRIELEMKTLPPGCKLQISTYTDDQWRESAEIANPAMLPERLWESHYRVLGRPARESEQPLPGAVCEEDAEPASLQSTEILVRSYPGQYLWLRLQFDGDGYATPEVAAVRVHYPRDSYLRYLPALYAAEDESRRFLESFLALFQTEWDAIESRLDSIARYFDPAAVPAGACLDYLARQWLALPLEGDWNAQLKRRLLMAAPAYYERRGTLAGLRRILHVYLANLTGLDELVAEGSTPASPVAAYPLLIEGYRKREFLRLQDQAQARLNRHHPIWSPAVVGRLQLDVFAREGEVRLVSTADPERDFFHTHAHRFQVILPSSWLGSRTDEAMLRRMLDREKPAHTRYELCLVESRFRVGIQSTVGVDTIIGAYPLAVLADASADTQAPVSRPPRRRLGYDTVLGGVSGQRGGFPLEAGTRVGINTVLS
jgi:phage tail-like protein